MCQMTPLLTTLYESINIFYLIAFYYNPLRKTTTNVNKHFVFNKLNLLQVRCGVHQMVERNGCRGAVHIGMITTIELDITVGLITTGF